MSQNIFLKFTYITNMVLFGNLKKKFILKILFWIYALFLIYVLFLCRDYSRGIRDSNLEMFATINRYIKAYKNDYMSKFLIFLNLFGNLFLFVPLGFFARSLFKMKNIFLFSSFTFFILCFIEFIQFISYTGTADIDDILLNIIGSIVSFILFRNIGKYF